MHISLLHSQSIIKTTKTMNNIVYSRRHSVILWVGLALLLFRCSEKDSLAPSAGVGGSMARFTIVGNYLYAVDRTKLHVLDISEAANPQLRQSQTVGFDIETIFPYNQRLFIGAESGMFIYDVQTDPAKPVRLSEYLHITACDPVVAEGNYAYVTLRSNNNCRGFANQLEVIDISDIKRPRQVKVIPMTNPAGLGIKNNLLFVCDGASGLKVFDRTDPINLRQIQRFDKINTFDVIPLDNTLLMVGSDGFFQYVYENDGLRLISQIPTVK